MKDFAKNFDSQKKRFLNLFRPVEDKYREIWKLYNATMPGCIKDCNKEVTKNNNHQIEGPQGIYWIGPNTKILFVGKYNYGWTRERDKYYKEEACQEPLNFFYTKTSHMHYYWEKIREISSQVIGKDYEECFSEIAATNYSKCWCKSKAIQNKLNDKCWENKFFENEIAIINAPINVLFTKDIDSDLTRYFPEGKLKVRKNHAPFSKGAFENKLFYLYYHPVRRSNDELNELIKDLKKEYNKLK